MGILFSSNDYKNSFIKAQKDYFSNEWFKIAFGLNLLGKFMKDGQIKKVLVLIKIKKHYKINMNPLLPNEL